MVLLETARLRLRRFTPDDVDRLVELDSDRYASEGAAALIEHGFLCVWADKISARALAGNRGSRAVMEKCGLRSITRSQWQS